MASSGDGDRGEWGYIIDGLEAVELRLRVIAGLVCGK